MRKPCRSCPWAKNTEVRIRGEVRVVGERNWGRDECLTCANIKYYYEYLERKRKYTRGTLITSIQDFAAALESDGFVYVNNIIYHSGWVKSWPYRMIEGMIRRKVMYRAFRKKVTE